MPTRLEILTDPSILDRKVAPLFSPEEDLYWDITLTAAKGKRDSDKGVEYYYRSKAVCDMMALSRCQKAQKRPAPYLNALICLIGSRGTQGCTDLETVYTDQMNDLWAQHDSPENRWWTAQILEGLSVIPRSYAQSAAQRYFKGVGKQKGIVKAGAGLLCIENGWKGRDVEAVIRVLYDLELGAPLLKQDVIDPYGAEARDAQEVTGANRFAMARTEYDVEFINELMALLAKRGMTPAVLGSNPKQPPKPRKEKVWVVGDEMRAKYGPDLPKGAKLQKVGQYPYWADSDYEYTWYGKNEVGTYLIEDKRRAVGAYGRHRVVSLREVDGMVVTSLPAAK